MEEVDWDYIPSLRMVSLCPFLGKVGKSRKELIPHLQKEIEYSSHLMISSTVFTFIS
jgi:hypothetical protein